MKAVVKQLVRQPSSWLCVAWLVFATAMTLLAPVVATHDPLSQDLFNVLSGPTAEHPLGTDSLGRDVLSRLLYGGQLAILASAVAVAVTLLVGVPLGLASGYLGKWLDAVTQRTMELILALPSLVIMLVVLSVFPGGLLVAMGVLGVMHAPTVVRVLRAQTLSIREEDYIAAARVTGLTDAMILRRHIMPRLTSTIVVQATLFAAIAMMVQAGLGFLGLGAKPPAPSLGGLIQDASQLIFSNPWMLVPSGVPLVLTVVAFMVLGERLRDASVAAWAGTARTAPRRTVVGTTATAAEPTPERSAEALLSVRDLTIEINGVPIVQHVNFDIAPGEALGVVGESGCGKSMTAFGVLGLLPAGGRIAEGEIWFDGVEISSRKSLLAAVRGKGIGYITQNPMTALDPTFSVGSQLAEAVRRAKKGLSRGEARTRVLELLRMAGIPDPEGIARRYPHQLSGGLAQRCTIALALAGEPRLLIADEPTTALDVSVQREILTLLHRLQDELGMAIMIVTHDWGVVADLCQRAVVMYAGQIVESADTETLYDDPAHPYSRALLQANPHVVAIDEPMPVIPGAVPPPGSWPLGCRFAPRCAFAADVCREAPVALAPVREDHDVRCVRVAELSARGERA